VKQHYNQLAGSVTQNVAKLSFASERMQAAERAYNFVVHFYLQTTSTVVAVSRYRSPFRSLLSRLIRRTLTQMRYRTVAVHRRWYRSLWTSTMHPCWRKAHGFRNFSMTGMIFLSIPSHFARIQFEQITVLHKF